MVMVYKIQSNELYAWSHLTPSQRGTAVRAIDLDATTRCCDEYELRISPDGHALVWHNSTRRTTRVMMFA